MKLNCDMGEIDGPGSMDAEVMPWIDLANIACGFHASNPDLMARTVACAVANKVAVGAHPGYDDKEGFGRRAIPHAPDQVTRLVAYQAGALDAICRLHGTRISYVKPHGALYNEMMAKEETYQAIVAAVAVLPDRPALMILAMADSGKYRQLAEAKGVPLLFEAFADRAYTDDGRLAPRSEPGAVYHDQERIVAQVTQLARKGTVTTVSGKELALNADTVCVHGDNPESVAVIKALRQALTS